MKRVSIVMITVLIILLCLSVVNAGAAGMRVEWNVDKLTTGELSVSVYGAEEGSTAVLALYDGNALSGVTYVKAENGVRLSLNVGKVGPDSQAKLFLWNWDNMSPAAAVLSTVTPEGIIDGSAHSGPALGSVSGLVWVDVDGDGICGEAEGAENIEVILTKDEAVIAETVTDENGAFTFTPVVVGEYTVSVSVPFDTEPLTGTTAAVTVAEDETATATFGFRPIIHTGTIAGTVWVDIDGDGEIGENEARIAGATVSLSDELTTVTSETGEYVFNEVVVGEYTLGVTDPAGREVIGENSRTITVVDGETARADFALKPLTGSVFGVIWNDADRDGEMDKDEEPFAGIEVTLGEDKVTTGEDGAYKFEGLLPGDYVIEFAVPGDYICTTKNETVKFSVPEGGKTEIMVGLAIKTGSVSGMVWNDTNGDGVKDGDETVMSGITVRITASDGAAKSVRTGADGSYSFEELVPGEYTISVSAPADREATLENPRKVTVISDDMIIENFGFKQLWVSDNQHQNKASSVAYHDIEPVLEGKYSISFRLTINTRGDNAILIGDSSNGTLEYGTSSAILLFSTDGNLAVRNGNGNGSYTAAAVNLCTAATGKEYTVTVEGDITSNVYTISVTDEDGKTYTSDELHARKNGSKLDTIALISNSHNTTVTNGNYSDFYFYIKGFHAEEVVEEPDDPVYDGFAGMYYGITVNGRYIRGNNGRISADYTSVRDDSAKFLPRDMADGTFALLCRSSNRRITTASRNSQLTSGDYATNDLTQHWYLEESENYSLDHLSYYLRSADNDMYIGVSGNYLTAVSEANKVELVFNPLNDESPLYQVSQTEAYARLTTAQRKRIETLYETVAGDVFGRYGGTDYTWGARGRLDAAFEEVLSGDLSEDEQYDRLVGMLSNDNGYLIQNGNITGYTVSTSLPGTENLRYEIDNGTYGNYDFWRGTMLDGTLYKLKIYDGDDLQQTIDLYVHDDGVPKQNMQTFLSVITKIPHIYRRNIRTVKIRSDTANSFNCGSSDLYIRLNYHMSDQNRMLGTLTHELNHSLDQSNGSWSHGSPWAKAMADDMIMATEYARTSVDEDFAEFGRLYVLCYENQDRQKALQLLFPNRYASYWRLRNNNLGGFELWEDTEYLDEYSNR